MDPTETLKKFISLGLSEQKAKETLKNAAVSKNILLALNHSGSAIEGSVGLLIYHLATKIKPQIIDHLPLIVKYIVEKKLDTQVRVDAALEFILTHGVTKDSINTAELEKACGVGIVVTPEEIDRAVECLITKNKTDLVAQRYRFNAGKILQEVRSQLPWADGKAVKAEVDVQIFDLLGPKTEADLAPPVKDKKPKEKKDAAPKAQDVTSDNEVKDSANSIAELMKNKVHFHAPGENFKTDGYVTTEHTDRLLKEHLQKTGGQVRTRFPPEPNGILHIGHAKAININFGYAAGRYLLSNDQFTLSIVINFSSRWNLFLTLR